MKKRTKKSIKTESKIIEVSVQEITQTLAEETINLLEEFSYTVGPEAKYRVLHMYLSNLISFMISDTFNQVDRSIPPEDRLERARKEFSTLKSTIEFAISDGVQSGINNSTGASLGYYCLIRSIPEPINKQMM